MPRPGSHRPPAHALTGADADAGSAALDVLVGAGVLTCVVVAARAGVFTSFEPVEIDRGTALGYAAAGALLGLAGGALLVRALRRRAAPPPERPLLSALWIVTVAVGAVTALTLAPRSPAAIDAPRPLPPATTQAGATPTSTTAVPAGSELFSSDGPESDVGSGFMGVIIGFGLVGLIAILVTYRRRVEEADRLRLPPLAVRRSPGGDADDVDDEAAARSFGDSARILLDDPDPRRAVIAAYAALLDGLDAAGVGRQQHEAPEEHLRRALATLRIPSRAAADVTHLFVVARFSAHPIGDAERSRAVGSLREAEAHLRDRVGTR